jgi:uncharacterized protein RhaS with RHS repeats
MNFYRYVFNNPSRFVDPNGLEVIDLLKNGISDTVKDTEAYRKANESPTKVTVYNGFEDDNTLGYTRPDPGVAYKKGDPVSIRIKEGQTVNDEAVTITHELSHANAIIDSNNKSNADYEHRHLTPEAEKDVLIKKNKKRSCGP